MHYADLELMKEFALPGQRGVPPGRPMSANNYMQIFFVIKNVASILCEICHKPQVIIKRLGGFFMPSIEQSLNERGLEVFLDRGKIWQNDLRCPPSWSSFHPE